MISINKTKKDSKIVSGLLTLYKDKDKEKNIYYPSNNYVKKRTLILQHMYTGVKLDNGYLITTHTSENELNLSEEIKIENIKDEGKIIKYSVPFFYINDEIFKTFVKTDFTVSKFPKNFQKNEEEVKNALAINLKNMYTTFLIDNKKFGDDHLLILREIEKNNKILNNLTINAEYVKKKNEIIVASYLGLYNKKTSKLFFECEDFDVETFQNIHKIITQTSDAELGDELTNNWKY